MNVVVIEKHTAVFVKWFADVSKLELREENGKEIIFIKVGEQPLGHRYSTENYKAICRGEFVTFELT